MKKRLMSKAKKLPWRFNTITHLKPLLRHPQLILTLLCFILFLGQGVAQRISRVFEQEINVTNQVVLKTYGPVSPRITGNGVIHTRKLAHNYVVSGRKSSEHIYVIDKRFDIHTWEANKVKQVTKVTVECETESQGQALFKDLRLELKENAAGQIRVDCELNIDKFMLENGWFKADDNEVVLSNGKKYKIKYLELTTSLYIPKGLDLEMELEEVELSLGDHEGRIELLMEQGSFLAESLNELKGRFNSVRLEIEQVNKGELLTKNAEVKIQRANELILESSLSNYQCKEVGRLLVNDSVNDKMNTGESSLFMVEQALYSEYKIGTIREAVEANLRNCNLTINELEKEVTKVEIKNHNATVKMGIQNLAAYTLTSRQVNQAKYQLPTTLQKVKSNETESIFTYGNQPTATAIKIDCALCEVILSEVPF